MNIIDFLFHSYECVTAFLTKNPIVVLLIAPTVPWGYKKLNDLFAAFFIKTLSLGGKKLVKWKNKKIESQINYHEMILSRVEKLNNKNNDILYELLEDLYDSISMILFYFLSFLFVNFLVSEMNFPHYYYYCWLGVVIKYMFSDVYMLFVNADLFKFSKKGEEFLKERQEQITLLKKLLN